MICVFFNLALPALKLITWQISQMIKYTVHISVSSNFKPNIFMEIQPKKKVPHQSSLLVLLMMEDNILKTMAISFGFLVLCVVIKLVHKIWWRPKSIERLLRKQGIEGTCYRLFTGDVTEMKNSVQKALSKPIPLNSYTQVVYRVIPYYHNMVQKYGETKIN